MITVAELIAQLQECPMDARVDVETPDGDLWIAQDEDLKVWTVGGRNQPKSYIVSLRGEA